jgi:hypothetical protein
MFFVLRRQAFPLKTVGINDVCEIILSDSQINVPKDMNRHFSALAGLSISCSTIMVEEVEADLDMDYTFSPKLAFNLSII